MRGGRPLLPPAQWSQKTCRRNAFALPGTLGSRNLVLLLTSSCLRTCRMLIDK